MTSHLAPGYGPRGDIDATGALLFSRYAYPPNELGYCGPQDHRAILEYGAAGATDRVRTRDLGEVLEGRFAGRAGNAWPDLRDAITPTARLSHAFHVFAVYPWVGLLRAGVPDHPLHVLDRCRIRWGRVARPRRPADEHITVVSRSLNYESGVIALGAEREERVRVARDGLGFVAEPREGDWVSLHWDWVCDRLSPRRLANLGRYTAATLELVNRSTAGLDW